MKKPLPWIATLVASVVFWIEPWLNVGEIDPVVTPRPTCIGFELVPPTVWLTRSWNDTLLALKPMVLMFARLLPMTPKATALALRPDSEDEKIQRPWLLSSIRRVLGRGPGRQVLSHQKLADRRHLRCDVGQPVSYTHLRAHET